MRYFGFRTKKGAASLGYYVYKDINGNPVTINFFDDNEVPSGFYFSDIQRVAELMVEDGRPVWVRTISTSNRNFFHLPIPIEDVEEAEYEDLRIKYEE